MADAEMKIGRSENWANLVKYIITYNYKNNLQFLT
jgi:hypothetical protein